MTVDSISTMLDEFRAMLTKYWNPLNGFGVQTGIDPVPYVRFVMFALEDAEDDGEPRKIIDQIEYEVPKEFENALYLFAHIGSETISAHNDILNVVSQYNTHGIKVLEQAAQYHSFKDGLRKQIDKAIQP